jgi:hypothetical protein
VKKKGGHHKRGKRRKCGRRRGEEEEGSQGGLRSTLGVLRRRRRVTEREGERTQNGKSECSERAKSYWCAIHEWTRALRLSVELCEEGTRLWVSFQLD